MSRAFREDDFTGAVLDRVRRAALGTLSAEDQKSRDAREKEEQAAVVKIFREAGCKVYNLSQARKTKQTPGLPDLWVVHLPSRRAFWFEVKRTRGGVMSEFQKDFASECNECGVRHFVGDRAEARRALRLQLITLSDGKPAAVWLSREATPPPSSPTRGNA